MWLTDFINSLGRPAPEWAVKYYETKGKYYQERYNKIKSWSFSPELKRMLEFLNEEIPEAVTKFLWREIDKAYKKFGPEQAERYIKTLIEKISKFACSL